MVIDSSAILAIVQNEPEKGHFTRLIGTADSVVISAVNYVECATVLLARRGAAGEEWFDRFLRETRTVVLPVDVNLAELARRAYRQYGKGNHEARLNLGDVFAYALSKSRGEPLLYKGDDFAHTDVISALA